MSLDMYIAPLAAPPALIKIDTEGNDARVLDGAFETLCARRIRVVTFEKGKTGSWAEGAHRLRDHMRRFERCGYGCYALSGRDPPRVVAKLTHGCWHDAWEELSWINVACVHASTAPEAMAFYEARRILLDPNATSDNQ